MVRQALYSQEAEEAVVGALFLQEGLIKECRLGCEHLYDRRLAALLGAMRAVDGAGKPVDVVSVAEELGAERLEGLGGLSYVLRLADSVPTTANFKFYEGIVLEYFRKRRVVDVAVSLIREVKSGDCSSSVQWAMEQLMLVEEQSFAEDDGRILDALRRLFDGFGRETSELCVSTGFEALDVLTGGLHPGHFVVVGARPSVGKTAFALNMAVNVAEEHVCLFFSLEMSAEELLKRLTCLVGDIETMRLRNPLKLFEEEDWYNLSLSVGKLSTASIRIFDQAGMDLSYIWNMVRKMRREFGYEKKLVVMVDYLQLIVGSDSYRHNRQAEISEISRSLKIMARELNVTVVALSQLSRAVEGRQNKRPMLSDLRESGQIEQDADVIAFLYRDDYYHKDSEERDTIEVIVAKQRNGPIGTVKLGFKKECGRFVGV